MDKLRQLCRKSRFLCSQHLRTALALITSPGVRPIQAGKELQMNVNQDLLGKTITGVIATRAADSGPREIWMLQFADGSHVEFVSPGARKALRGVASQRGSQKIRRSSAQAKLKPAVNDSDKGPGHRSGQSMKLTDSRSMCYQRDREEVVQLKLNVA